MTLLKRRAAFLFGPVSALLLGGAAPVATKKPAMSPTAASGDIQLFQSTGRVMVMMRIGQGELVPMIFDTGSDGHSIDQLIVAREKLRRIGTTREIDGTTGKERQLPRVALRNLTVGGLPIARMEAVALDYDRDDAMGIFTPEMFTESLLYLDLGNSVARLVKRASATLPAGPPTAYVENIPSVQMVMPDGSNLPAHFDTGYNGALSLPVAMMKTLPLMAPARVVGRFKSINTEGEVYGGQVRGTIRIGPLELVNPSVTFLGDLANIGLPIIRQVTLVIDPGNKRAWVLPTGAKPAKLQ